MIQPRNNNVLIEPEKLPELSKILIIPENTTAKPPARGTVLAIGPKVLDVRVGDTVCFERFDWSQAPECNIIIREDEILCIIH